MRPTIRIAAVTLALGLLFTGCSKSSPSTAAAPPSSGGAAGTAVQIKGFKFSPSPITVKVGDTVTFTNQDSSTHRPHGTGGPAGFDTGDLATGKKGSVKLTKAGTYKYQCSIHNYMTGTITVS